jgi:hypothetical protein
MTYSLRLVHASDHLHASVHIQVHVRNRNSVDALVQARRLDDNLDLACDNADEVDSLRELAVDLARACGRVDDLIKYLEARGATALADRTRGRQEAPQVALIAGRLVTAATRLLPVRAQARYAEEFRSELWEIAHTGGTWCAQLAYAARQMRAAGRLRAALRAPRRPAAAPRRAR